MFLIRTKEQIVGKQDATISVIPLNAGVFPGLKNK
jgi:hypothetical protein